MASGIAVALLARASAAAVAAEAQAGPRSGRPVFVAETRIADAGAALRAATQLGATPRSFESDVTPVYEWLDLELRSASVPVAGLTTAHALFAIERLAWDRGLRTVYRGLHRGVRGPAPSHELVGSPTIIERIEHVDADDWAESIGRALAGTAPGPADYGYLVTSQQVPRNDDDVLVSWLLAPRERLLPDGRPAGASSRPR